MPPAEVAIQMRALLASWKGGTGNGQQGFQLEAANRLWCQEGFKLLPSFWRHCSTTMGRRWECSTSRTRASRPGKRSNTWVEERTGRRIKDLIPTPQLLERARLVLTKRRLLQGIWSEPFDKARTTPQPFLLSAGQSVETPFMQKTATYRYMANGDLQVLQLPYGDGSLSMFILLPTKKEGLAELEPKLTAANLTTWIRALRSQEVVGCSPEVHNDVAIRAGSGAQGDGDDVGVRSDGLISRVMARAPGSGLVGCASQGFRRRERREHRGGRCNRRHDQRRQPWRIQPEPRVFRADHPFALLIRDDRTETVLFLGRIVDPRR